MAKSTLKEKIVNVLYVVFFVLGVLSGLGVLGCMIASAVADWLKFQDFHKSCTLGVFYCLGSGFSCFVIVGVLLSIPDKKEQSGGESWPSSISDDNSDSSSDTSPPDDDPGSPTPGYGGTI